MKFTVDANHLDFFQKNHMIEFDSLLNDRQLASLKSHVQRTLSQRLEKLASTPDDLFKSGRDLFRVDGEMRKQIGQRQFAEIAYELMQQKPLRLGYDQFFPSLQKSPFETPYAHLLKSKPTLLELSSLQGIVCGLMICLKAGDRQKEGAEAPSVFSRTPGNAVFFNTSAVLDLECLTSSSESNYLLIVYVSASSVYVLNTMDPNTYELKKYGYSLGDKLNDKLNPIILR